MHLITCRLLAVLIICTGLLGCQRTTTAPDVAAASVLGGKSSFTNPVLNEDFPDPTVIKAADGYYYAYGTQTERKGKVLNIQVARSRDLVAWEHLGDALPQKPAWADTTQNFWAPHVSFHDGRYYLYYSAEPNIRKYPVKGKEVNGLCLAVATATSPAGPFVDSGQPMECGPSFVNIDPMSFDDPATGKRLLYWGSGFEPIKVRELAPNRTSFAPGSTATNLIKADTSKTTDSYQKLVEGAWVVMRDGWYYLFYSGDNCCGPKAHYAVLVARSRSATGPFETLAQATGRPNSAVLVRNNQWLAPGHNSVITDAAGHDWIAYHAINTQKTAAGSPAGSGGRVMLLDRLEYQDGWPRVAANGTPSAGAVPVPATNTTPAAK
ncbi:glycoside hydrolase family 43 protein [Hymenobacter sp. HDW8]|uniref:glycoside hydrolase family 43 protein n=1 Tax=Hymenobacter sp. HDW8 TaxID=2714932 RepID=UPI00140B8382|nr:glycoside hydrolase family 43 protein [Hymenobacter sp. HDW8]QIL76904.1 family 43 glycosylhydrolase [Hymenobacter sp. HDW8]